MIAYQKVKKGTLQLAQGAGRAARERRANGAASAQVLPRPSCLTERKVQVRAAVQALHLESSFVSCVLTLSMIGDCLHLAMQAHVMPEISSSS